MKNKKNLKICIHGKVGGTEGKDGRGKTLNVQELFSHFKQKVIDPNSKNFNIQIFIHCWSVEEEDTIVNLYSPSNYKFEKPESSIPRQLSKLKSLFSCMEIADLENSNNNDIVLATRLDLFYKKDLEVSEIINDAIDKLDSSEFIVYPGDPPSWSSGHHRSLRKIRLADDFFIGHVSDIRKFFNEKNLDRLTQSIMDPNKSPIFCRKWWHSKSMPENHRIARNIFEDDSMIEKMLMGNGNRMNMLMQLDKKEVDKCLKIQIVRTPLFVSQVDLFAARLYPRFH